MRDLTEEEIELAPHWATHYYIYSRGDLMYMSKYQYRFKGAGITHEKPSGIPDGSKPIPRKPFDISEHVFNDDDMQLSEMTINEHEAHIMFADEICELYLDKNYVIAIAKALGVTSEDL